MAARVVLAALALVVLACLSIALRNVVLMERAQKIAALPDPSPAQVDEAERLFEQARLLDPDTRPLLLEGALLARAGRQDEGVASVEQAVRHEPDNVLAWGVLAAVTREADSARSRAAEARRLELSPRFLRSSLGLLAPGHQRHRERKRHERHGRRLPVPVEAGVYDPYGEPGGARGESGVGAPQSPRGDRDAAEEREQRREADEPELAERSEVERVRLAGRDRARHAPGASRPRIRPEPIPCTGWSANVPSATRQ